MGVDVELYAKSKKRYSEKELKHINYRFMEACSLGEGKKPITLEQNEWIPKDDYYYRVSTLSRYYGIGYERGDWPSIYATIEWLRYNIEDSDVYYFGDYSDIGDQEPFTKDEQETIMRHWLKYGGLPYRAKPIDDTRYSKDCPNCEVMMTRFMWHGENGAGIACQGCGHSEITEDGGKTWEIKQESK